MDRLYFYFFETIDVRLRIKKTKTSVDLLYNFVSCGLRLNEIRS